MSTSDVSVESLETLVQVISSGVQELRIACAEGTTRQLEQLDFLKAMFLNGARISDAFRNVVLPVNRLPREILTHIFSLLRDELSIPAHFPARWPFKMYKAEPLEPLLAVCRRWRELALATPSLWNNIAINDRRSNNHFIRSIGVPLSINIVPRYTRQTDAWCRNVDSQIQQLHIDVFEGEEEPDSLSDFLQTFSATRLLHCKIDAPYALFFRSLSVAPTVSLFGGNGSNLRSLYLASVSFLPANAFPSLTRFTLCFPTYIPPGHGGKPWDICDLKFLAGSPLLEELYLCRIQVHFRAPPPSNARRSPSVKLPRLRYFAFDAYRELDIVQAIRTIDSAIIPPPSCHRYYTSLRPNIIAEYLSTLSPNEPFRRLRIDFSGRNLLQLSGKQGSISMSMPVKSGVDWRRLHTAFRTSRVFEDIEELWICLSPIDYGLIRFFQPLFTWFPRVRGLSITLNPLYSPHQLLSLEYVLGTLHVGIICPLLDTLCVNLSGNVTSVDPLECVLRGRALGRPLRRLVIGYDPRLEMNVLGDVLALEELVDEFVVGEVMVPVELASDWLLDIPNAFDEASPVKEGWARWSPNPL
ncbi:hypothetical protein L226DRAFT_538535 [Lentinus tigrinus ALCF2SS1-7]